MNPGCLQGYVTTLKRNGSDYSATILGALFNAGHITIWTDVDGVFSADPRKVARCRPFLLCFATLNVLHVVSLSGWNSELRRQSVTHVKSAGLSEGRRQSSAAPLEACNSSSTAVGLESAGASAAALPRASTAWHILSFLHRFPGVHGMPQLERPRISGNALRSRHAGSSLFE